MSDNTGDFDLVASRGEIARLQRELEDARGDLEKERATRILIEQKVSKAHSVARGLLDAKLLSWADYKYPVIDGATGAPLLDADGKQIYRTVVIDYIKPTFWLQGVVSKAGEPDKPLNGLVRAVVRNGEWIYIMFRDRHAVTNDLEAARALAANTTAYSLTQIFTGGEKVEAPSIIPQ